MTRFGQRRIVVVTVAAFVLLAFLVMILYWDQIRLIVGKAQWQLASAGFLSIIVSCLCLSFGYVLVNQVFGIVASSWKSFEIGFLSTTLNNVLGFLGAAGHSMRVELIEGQKNDAGEVLAGSIFHSYLNNVTFLLMLAFGLVSLLVSQTVYGGSVVGLALIAILMVMALAVCTALMFVTQLKSGLLRLLKRVWHSLTHRDIGSFLADLDHGLTRGVVALRNRPGELILLLILMVAEWAFQALALWFCFAAFGNVPNVWVLLSGFGIGLSAGSLSFVPGGLGVQDASMAGIYSLLGMSFTQAVLVAILFRVVSDFIPFLVSLPFYAQLVRRQPS